MRTLCPEAEQRAAMTDDEFWAHVLPSAPEPGPDDEEPDLPALVADPCRECGATGACAYDAEGRALIHAVDPED